MGEPVVIAVTADEIAQATFVANMQQIVREASAMFSLNPKEACKMEPIRRPKLPRRNEKCPCGSGLKAKNCCLPQMKALASIPPDVRRQIIVNRILRRQATPLPAVPENLAKLNGAGVIQFDGGSVTVDGITVPLQSGEITVNATLPESEPTPETESTTETIV